MLIYISPGGRGERCCGDEENRRRIGGEGNGGVIYPALHYGRDALAGIALFLSHLAKSGKSCSQLRGLYPDYFIAKKKIDLTGDTDLVLLRERLARVYPGATLDMRDGIRLDLPSGWVQVRKSNTEPIMRIYAEERTREDADRLADIVIDIVKNL